MSASRSRIPAFARWSALPVGLVLSAALVWQASYAAFTATTTNPSNNWTTGTVVLSDNDANAALWTLAGNVKLKGGSTDTKCIEVTYSGNLAATIKLYAANLGTTDSPTKNLSDYIDISVDEGTGTCAAFTTGTVSTTETLTAFGARTNFTGGLFGTWAPNGTATVTKPYRITYTVKNAITNAQQAANASVEFVWEAQQT